MSSDNACCSTPGNEESSGGCANNGPGFKRVRFKQLDAHAYLHGKEFLLDFKEMGYFIKLVDLFKVILLLWVVRNVGFLKKTVFNHLYLVV